MAKGQLMRDDLTGKRFGRLVVLGEYGKDAIGTPVSNSNRYKSMKKDG